MMNENYARYYVTVREDAKDFLNECGTEYDEFDEAFDDMFNGRVTGNDNGSYYCNAARAKEMIGEAVWDCDFLSGLEDYYCDHIFRVIEEGPETFDVIIRCYILDELYGSLKEYWENVVSRKED